MLEVESPFSQTHMTSRFFSLAAAAVLLVSGTASAQQASTGAFGKGSKILSVGVLAGGDYEGFGVGGSFEVGVIDFTPSLSLGVGAFAGVVRDNVDYGFGTFGGEYTLTSIPVMAIGNVHLGIASQPKLDLFGGVSLGIIASRFSYDDNTPSGFTQSANDSDVGLGIQVGARYNFTSSITGMAQLGVNDIPLLYAGLSFRF